MKTTVSNILMLIRENRSNRQINDTAVGVIRTAGIPATAYPLVIEAMAKFVKNNVMFVRDPYRTDEIFSPIHNLNLGYGDCEDHTVTVASLLGSIGFPIKVVIVSKDGRMWDHVFLRAGYPPDSPTYWMSVDTTISPPWGREIPFVDEKIYEAN